MSMTTFLLVSWAEFEVHWKDAAQYLKMPSGNLIGWPGTVTDVTILFSKVYLLQLATLARLSPPYILSFFTYIDLIEVYVPSIESRMFKLTEKYKSKTIFQTPTQGYCTISNCSAVTGHGPSWRRQIWSVVTGHIGIGQPWPTVTCA